MWYLITTYDVVLEYRIELCCLGGSFGIVIAMCSVGATVASQKPDSLAYGIQNGLRAIVPVTLFVTKQCTNDRGESLSV